LCERQLDGDARADMPAENGRVPDPERVHHLADTARPGFDRPLLGSRVGAAVTQQVGGDDAPPARLQMRGQPLEHSARERGPVDQHQDAVPTAAFAQVDLTVTRIDIGATHGNQVAFHPRGATRPGLPCRCADIRRVVGPWRAAAWQQRSMSASEVWALNLAFVLFASAVLAWAQWRTVPGPAFPGPAPVGPVFKVWLVVIWVVGLLLPVAALIIEPAPSTRAALLPYLVTFILQVATEIFIWKRWRSPIWVMVPCLYLPWRLFQSWMGLGLVDGAAFPLTEVTLWALVVLWAINIGVHYSNVVNTLRWSYHPADATFPALHDPRVFVKDTRG
jgi:hypothetical protein